jgi:hypothetical protein
MQRPSLPADISASKRLPACVSKALSRSRNALSSAPSRYSPSLRFFLGSTLFLLFGAAPAGIGLALGLLAQSLFFAPQDLPQYGMNVTSLLVPLFGLEILARRIIAPGTAYVNISYRQALALSGAFQAGVVAWVAFWVLYGSGFSVETLASLGKFGGAYMSVILGEPLVDLAVLALAKFAHGAQKNGITNSGLVTRRLYRAA